MFTSWLWAHALLLAGYVLAIVGIAHMLRHRRSPGATIAWLMAFMLFPYVGVALYLMFGGRKVRLNKAAKRQLVQEPKLENVRGEAGVFDRMLSRYGIAPATLGNRVSLCPTGVEGYAALQAIIEQAQRTLYIQTFIFSHDEVAQDILARAADKARQGVRVCVLVDGLGSLKTGRAFFQPLVRAGGRFAVFKPVLHVPFRGMTNLRNHRKIAVADGCHALAGGMNITAEDMYPQMQPDSWQDLSAVVEGPAARHLEDIFRADWQFATGEELASGIAGEAPPCGDAMVQVVPSGPDVPLDPLYCATITVAYRAQRRLWMVTPYFVPDDALAQAITIACRRGVDVRVLIPQKSNHPFSDLAGASFLRDIEAAGGSVHLYTAGMVHAKAMVADDDLAMVGSANLDMRSLFLNYEVMLLSYSPAEVAEVAAWIERLAQGCRCGVPAPGFARELSEGLLRVVSPLF
jgi:cardiolipin synthase